MSHPHLVSISHLLCPLTTSPHLTLRFLAAGLYDANALKQWEYDRVFSVRPIIKTKSFDIRKINSSDGTWLIAKSARRPTDKTRSSLRHQFLALEELHRKTGAALGTNVPLPLFLREDGSVLMMSLIPGLPLHALLGRKRIAP